MKRSSAWLAGGVVGGHPPARGPLGRRVLRLGLIGCGPTGREAVQALLAAEGGPVQLAALADGRPDLVQACYRGLRSRFGPIVEASPAARLSGPGAPAALLERDVDAVVVAGPPGMRPWWAAAAVEAGRHVYAVHPAAADAAGVAQLLAAERRAAGAGLGFAAGLMDRHDPRVAELARRVRQGALGRPQLLRAYWNAERPAPGRKAPRSARANDGPGAGPGMSDAVAMLLLRQSRQLDVAQWVLGSPPAEVHGCGGPMPGAAGEQYFLEYVYPDGVRLYAQCRAAAGCWRHVSLRLRGTAGEADFSRGALCEWDGSVRWRAPSPGRRAAAIGHAQHFVDGLRRGEPIREGAAAAAALWAALVGREAARRGRWLSCRLGPGDAPV